MCFVIWQGTEEELLAFTIGLNNNLKNIKLTVTYSQDSVEFIDVMIFKDQEGYIQMDMFPEGYGSEFFTACLLLPPPHTRLRLREAYR